MKIKRSQVKHFLKVDDDASGNAIYALMNEGVTTGKINMNPKTTEETYIAEDTASISVDSYAPTMPVEMTAVSGDDVFDFVDGLRKSRAVLSDAETEVVNVWLYEAAVGGAYPAEKQAVSIAVDDFGGDGGQPTKINFTLNYVGDATVGTFNPSTLTFTPDA